MKRSFSLIFLSLAAMACSARGGGDLGPVGPVDDVPATDDLPVTPDAPVTPDVPPVDVPQVDVPPVDAPSEDRPAFDVPSVDAPPPPDSTGPRCARDSECTGSTWCDTASGVCMPIVCTPGRVSCLSPTRARLCDSRGSMFTEMDCAGGCSSGVCTGGMMGCAAPSITCAGACVDPRSDALNCGTCGNACASGQACSSGVCTGGTTCGRPLVDCRGTCVNTQTDVRNCGACANACPTGQACAAGVCTGGACPTGLVRCGTACVDTQGDPGNCGTCGRVCPSGQSCSAGLCAPLGMGPSLRITSLGATGCMVSEHGTASGDDRGGIAVGSSAMLYTGDTSTLRFNLDSLASTTLARIYDGLVSNLRTGIVYSLATATGPLLNTMSGATITSLVELDATTALPTTRSIALSMPLTLAIDTGVFAGWDRVVLASNGRVYNVDLPSGRVTDLGAMVFPMHQQCENWAFWGVAEYFDGRVHLSYVESATRVARVRVPDATVTTVGTFTNLSDMCSFSVSPARGRWYFHHEYAGQFGGSGETVGYCPAVISAGGTVACSAPMTLCGADCVDLTSDLVHCGACGRACTTGQTCRAGTCSTPTSLPNYTRTVPPSSVTFVDVCSMSSAMRVLAGLDDQSVVAPMPFTFTFWGAALPTGRTVNISSNGFISLDGMSGAGWGSLPATAAPNGQILAWGTDIVASATPGVCYATLGAAPARRFVVQWANARPYGSTTGLISTEIVLSEGDGAIDVLTSNYTFPSTSTGYIGVENLAGTRAVSGCAVTTGVCTNSAGNRVRFAPSP